VALLAAVDVAVAEAGERIEFVWAANIYQGGMKMRYGIGRRGGAGFGFRGGSPPWPYVGRGRGGLPRCWYPNLGTAAYSPAAPYFAGWTGEREVDWLKNQAESVKAELNRVEARIRNLEASK
jgi:hypothetical protein